MKKLLPLLAASLLVSSIATHASAIDLGELRRAHEDILRLDVADAHKALAGVSDEEPTVAREMALLAIYEGDCDAATTLLGRRSLQEDEGAAGLAEIARGCARVTASTLTIRDDKRGIIVRLKDEDDAPIVPYLLDVADAALATLEHDLGVSLPRPLHIEVVKDHYSLAAMTGLPEEAAQTTGTVAVAKWGRVTMLSPRAAPHGYPWADTLMHELTHLAVTRASADRAPLWLQEGVAKREETRWRQPWLYDDHPSADAVAKRGFDKGLALALDKLGPSIAMLPSAEQAMVAFSEVTSFVRFWIKQEGDDALPKLLAALAEAPDKDAVNAALVKVSGASLVEWNDRWRKYLATIPADAGADAETQSPKDNAKKKGGVDAYREARLGELLAERSHAAEAVPYLERGETAAPRDPSIRSRLSLALRAIDRGGDAAKLVESREAVGGPHALFLALHASGLRAKGDDLLATESFLDALHISPFELEVACEDREKPLLPSDPARAALCTAARNTRRR